MLLPVFVYGWIEVVVDRGTRKNVMTPEKCPYVRPLIINPLKADQLRLSNAIGEIIDAI